MDKLQVRGNHSGSKHAFRRKKLYKKIEKFFKRKKETKDKKDDYLQPVERGQMDARYLSESISPPQEDCPKTFLSEPTEMTKLVTRSNP